MPRCPGRRYHPCDPMARTRKSPVPAPPAQAAPRPPPAQEACAASAVALRRPIHRPMEVARLGDRVASTGTASEEVPSGRRPLEQVLHPQAHPWEAERHNELNGPERLACVAQRCRGGSVASAAHSEARRPPHPTSVSCARRRRQRASRRSHPSHGSSDRGSGAPDHTRPGLEQRPCHRTCRLPCHLRLAPWPQALACRPGSRPVAQSWPYAYWTASCAG